MSKYLARINCKLIRIRRTIDEPAYEEMDGCLIGDSCGCVSIILCYIYNGMENSNRWVPGPGLGPWGWG